MAIVLSKRDLKNIVDYRYETNPWTSLDHVFNPWWEFVTEKMPRWLAPNVITLLGAAVPMVSFVNLCVHDLTTKEVLP